MKNNIDLKLNKILNLVTKKMQTYLDLCESPIEKMFLLNYFERIFDSQTSSWFSWSSEDKNRPFFKYENNENIGKFYPSGIKWHESGSSELNSRISLFEYELYPQFEIKDNNNKAKYRIDFALFYPRTDRDKDKIKIAIECDGIDYYERTNEQVKSDKEKDSFLQKKGWLVVRFTGSEILNKDVYDLFSEIDKFANNKDYELFNESKLHKNNWKLN